MAAGWRGCVLFHNSLNVKGGPKGRREAVSPLTFKELRKEWPRSANGGKSPLALLSDMFNTSQRALHLCIFQWVMTVLCLEEQLKD